jgi:hypothetical protein
VKYWNRLCALPDRRLLKKAFLESISLNTANKKSWTTSFRALFRTTRLGLEWPCSDRIEPHCRSQRSVYIAMHGKSISQSPDNIKLTTYSMMGSDGYCMQSYLASIKDREVSKSLTKFRAGSHWLEIQQGRFTRTDRALRLCKKCGSGSVEDENHMLFQCPVYQHVRVKYAELLESAHDLKSFSDATQTELID